MKKSNLNNFIPTKVKQIGKTIIQNLDLPQEITRNAVKITCISNIEVLIENYKALVEYSDLLIRITTNNKTVKIEGKSLNIDKITDENLMVRGSIKNINFI